MGVSGYYPVIIRSSFSPDRYPVDYYPVLSGKTVSSTSLNPTGPYMPLSSAEVIYSIYNVLRPRTIRREPKNIINRINNLCGRESIHATMALYAKLY
jgi:hypothetical protein